MTSPPTYTWTSYEARFLACNPNPGASNIIFCEYLRALEADKHTSRAAHLASLGRVTNHIIASGATELTTTGSYLFSHFCKYKVWQDGFNHGLEPHHIAVFALATITNMYSEEPSDYDEMQRCLQEWLGTRFSFAFETRARDLSELLFGSIWTELFEGELRQTRSIINAVMSTKPDIVGWAPAAPTYAAGLLPADFAV